MSIQINQFTKTKQLKNQPSKINQFLIDLRKFVFK